MSLSSLPQLLSAGLFPSGKGFFSLGQGSASCPWEKERMAALFPGIATRTLTTPTSNILPSFSPAGANVVRRYVACRVAPGETPEAKDLGEAGKNAASWLGMVVVHSDTKTPNLVSAVSPTTSLKHWAPTDIGICPLFASRGRLTSPRSLTSSRRSTSSEGFLQEVKSDGSALGTWVTRGICVLAHGGSAHSGTLSPQILVHTHARTRTKGAECILTEVRRSLPNDHGMNFLRALQMLRWYTMEISSRNQFSARKPTDTAVLDFGSSVLPSKDIPVRQRPVLARDAVAIGGRACRKTEWKEVKEWKELKEWKEPTEWKRVGGMVASHHRRSHHERKTVFVPEDDVPEKEVPENVTILRDMTVRLYLGDDLETKDADDSQQVWPREEPKAKEETEVTADTERFDGNSQEFQRKFRGPFGISTRNFATLCSMTCRPDLRMLASDRAALERQNRDMLFSVTPPSRGLFGDEESYCRQTSESRIGGSAGAASEERMKHVVAVQGLLGDKVYNCEGIVQHYLDNVYCSDQKCKGLMRKGEISPGELLKEVVTKVANSNVGDEAIEVAKQKATAKEKAIEVARQKAAEEEEAKAEEEAEVVRNEAIEAAKGGAEEAESGFHSL